MQYTYNNNLIFQCKNKLKLIIRRLSKSTRFIISHTYIFAAIREDGMPGGRNKSIGPVYVSF